LIGKIRKNRNTIQTTADITRFLLEEAKLAIVSFTAFGCEKGTDWFRISIGTLKESEIDGLLRKLESAFSELE
jgi:aspartate aminotransferase